MRLQTNGCEQLALSPARAMLVLGLFAQGAQVLLFREVMARTHGTELLFGVTLACWLLWTALGAALGQWRGRAPNSEARRADTLARSAWLNGPLLAALIVLVRAAPWMPGATAGQVLALPNAVGMIALCMGPVALLGGYQFCLALRLAGPERFGALYRAEAWGGLLGGLATGFVLVELGALARMGLLLGAGLYLACILLLKREREEPRRLLRAAAALVVLLALAALPLDRWSIERRWRQTLPACGAPRVIETRHGRLAAFGPEDAPASVYQNGGLLAAPGSDRLHAAHLAAFLDAQGARPARRILLVGGTLSALPAALLEGAPDRRIDLVEHDPAILAWSGAPAGSRRVAMDPRRFLQQAPSAIYDLILVFSAEPDNAAANRLCTAECFTHAGNALAPGGVFALVLPSWGASAEYTGPLLALRTESVRRALGEMFPSTEAVPLAGHLLLGAKQPQALALDPETLGARLLARNCADRLPAVFRPAGGAVTRESAASYFATIGGGVLEVRQGLFDDARGQPAVEAFVRALTESDAPPNRDHHPVTVLYSLAFGNEILGGRTSDRFFRAVVGIDTAHVWTVLGGLMLAAAAGFAAGRGEDRCGIRRVGVLLGAGATGYFAMTMNIGLLYAYQNLCGYVYAEIGLLAGLFMAGLALGAGWSDRARACPERLLPVLLLGMVALAGASPWLIGQVAALASTWPGRILVAGLIFLAGTADGASFPLLAKRVRDWPRAGGWLYAADLLGACVAGGLGSAVLLPATGLATTFATAGGLVCAALLLLWPRGSAAI